MLKTIIKTFFTVLVIAGIIFLVAYKSYQFGEKLGVRTADNVVETR